MNDDIPPGVWRPIAWRSMENKQCTWKHFDDAPMTLDKARKAHDSGVLDMAQRKEEDVVIQLIRVRNKPDHNREKWFSRYESDYEKHVIRRRDELLAKKMGGV